MHNAPVAPIAPLDPRFGASQASIMGDPAKPLESVYDRFLRVPDTMVAEIINGELVTQPRPAAAHANVASNLGGELHNPFRRGHGGPGGWIILDEPEIHLRGGHIFAPDLVGWRRDRLPEVPDTPAFELAPDWVCEILSPSTAARDRTEKMPVYGEAGVRHLWLLDPALRVLEVYRLDAARWVSIGAWRDDARVRAEPFDAIELELAVLWAR
jgi:Uma2 family endonuclease